jgi:hypothetical protein
MPRRSTASCNKEWVQEIAGYPPFTVPPWTRRGAWPDDVAPPGVAAAWVRSARHSLARTLLTWLSRFLADEQLRRDLSVGVPLGDARARRWLVGADPTVGGRDGRGRINYIARPLAGVQDVRSRPLARYRSFLVPASLVLDAPSPERDLAATRSASNVKPTPAGGLRRVRDLGVLRLGPILEVVGLVCSREGRPLTRFEG